MAKWGYDIRVTNIGTTSGGDATKVWRDKDDKGKSTWDYVKEEGMNKWELVNVFPVAGNNGSTVQIVWVYKKPW